MIRINLLHGTRPRKVSGQLDVRVEAGVAVALLVVVFGGCWYYSDSLSTQIEAKQLETAGQTTQIQVLKKEVKKVEDFEKKKKQLEAKSQIIDKLEQDRVGPVKVLDTISKSLDPLKLWLTSLKVKGKKVEVNGRALTNDDVVGFVNNLRRGGEFKNINLGEILSKTKGRDTIRVLNFKLKMDLNKAKKNKKKGKRGTA